MRPLQPALRPLSDVEVAVVFRAGTDSSDATFVFPARRNIDGLCAAPFLMAFGLFAISSEVDSISSGGVANLSGWIAIGVIVFLLAVLVFSTLWQVFGSEVVSLTGTHLQLSRVLFGMRRSWSFELSEVRDLKVGTTDWDLLNPLAHSDWFDASSPCVSLTYRWKIVRFGAGVGPIEVNRVIRRIQEQLETASRATSA